ncbi:Uu.00g142960.m01.CDS01 [Anthostomella pinea]|uniref:Uu.00g142960.m01.CDS01 n=1 Tax=Anthostomella pinea TaxID=933095 RepID=A0AAI8VQM1_9PEZI|nr:Uu.00g142960.m01.CDS01 [Anthostomella pinea]
MIWEWCPVPTDWVASIVWDLHLHAHEARVDVDRTIEFGFGAIARRKQIMALLRFDPRAHDFIHKRYTPVNIMDQLPREREAKIVEHWVYPEIDVFRFATADWSKDIIQALVCLPALKRVFLAFEPICWFHALEQPRLELQRAITFWSKSIIQHSDILGRETTREKMWFLEQAVGDGVQKYTQSLSDMNDLDWHRVSWVLRLASSHLEARGFGFFFVTDKLFSAGRDTLNTRSISIPRTRSLKVGRGSHLESTYPSGFCLHNPQKEGLKE